MSLYKEIINSLAAQYRTPPPKTRLCAILAPPGTVITSLEEVRQLGSVESPSVVWADFTESLNGTESPKQYVFHKMLWSVAFTFGAAVRWPIPLTFKHDDTVYFVFWGDLPEGYTWAEIVLMPLGLSDMGEVFVCDARPLGVTVSIAPMTGTEIWDGEVDVARLADFLVETGDALIKAGFPDVRFVLQPGATKARDEG